MASDQPSPKDNISWRVLVGTTVTIVPATICVIVRFVARHASGAGLWWDDYTIAISLVINWGMAALRWAQIPLYDYGRHPQFVSQEKKTAFAKSFLAVQTLYYVNATMTRTSLLLLYHRIFGIVKGFRWALGVSGFLVIGYFIACVTVSIAGCSPVAKFWHTSLPGHCIDEVAFFRWNGVANMFLDFLVLLLPLPMVWRVNTTRRQKWILTGIFLLGGFVCVVSIIRVVNFDGSSFADPTYESVGPVTWSSVEQSVAIICACLPTFRPLFRVLYGPSKSTSDSNNSSLANSQDHASSPRLMSQCDEDSSIIAIVQSPLSRQEMRGAHVHRSDVTDSTRSPTSMFKDDERPESQGSQADRPVSAEKSST